MDQISLPEVPTLVVTVINLLAPYLVAIINQPRWSAGSKRLIAVAGSFLLTLVALVVVAAVEGSFPGDSWVALLLIGLATSQASYALITKPTAAKVEQAINAGPLP